MPEALEVELYRQAAEATVGKWVRAVDVLDPLVVPDDDLPELLGGRRIEAARRHGKVLLLDTTGPTLGLRFGMTGRLLVGPADPVSDLAYGAVAQDRRYDRLVLHVSGLGEVRLSDARRLARVTLDPSLDGLGPDVLGLRRRDLAAGLANRLAPVKAILLDQSVVAGLGNMLVDEVLWRAGIDPARRAGSLDAAEMDRLHRAIRRALPEMLARGGSHAGRLSAAHRTAGAACPLDGSPLQRRTIGGRTTWSCPVHQR